jgi:hypothetical protein
MIKRAFLHIALSLTCAVGMLFKVIGESLLGIAELIMLALEND